MRALQSVACILSALLAVAAAPPSARADADDSAARLIAEYGLRAAPQPVRSWARWRAPQRIAVDGGVPGLQAAAQLAAPAAKIAVANNGSEMAAAVAAGAEVIIGRTQMLCNDAVMAAGTSLRWVQTVYAGVERCLAYRDKFRQQLLLTNMRAIGGPVIAEHSIAMLLALTRGLHVTIPRQRGAEWNPDLGARTQPRSLRGKTLLVVGLGGIGLEVARRAHALDMQIIATRASSRDKPDFVSYVGLPSELPQLIARADVVVNAAPLTQATIGLFDAKMFARMKPSAYFINVARGAAVVSNDLAAALETGAIAGAGVDVTEPEPLPKDHALWRAPNLVLTPHMAGEAEAGFEVAVQVSKENLRRYVAGEGLLSLVDLDREY